MRYGSVCSGIEAATAAWHPLGWEASFFSEIDAAPRAVLRQPANPAQAGRAIREKPPLSHISPELIGRAIMARDAAA